MFGKSKKEIASLRAELHHWEAEVNRLEGELVLLRSLLGDEKCSEVEQKNIESQAKTKQNNGDYKNGEFLRSFAADEQFYPEENAPKDR